MKIIIFLLVIFPKTLLCQTKKTYIEFGPSFNINKSSLLIGGSLGVGVLNTNAGFGLGINVYTFEKSALIPLYSDFRFYFKPSRVRKYFLLQPGYTIRSKTIPFGSTKIVESGGIFVASGIGITTHFPKFSITYQIKYSIISTKATYQTEEGVYISSTKSSPGYLGFCLFFIPGNYM